LKGKIEKRKTVKEIAFERGPRFQFSPVVEKKKRRKAKPFSIFFFPSEKKKRDVRSDEREKKKNPPRKKTLGFSYDPLRERKEEERSFSLLKNAKKKRVFFREKDRKTDTRTGMVAG
jgi:hypothetical protein